MHIRADWPSRYGVPAAQLCTAYIIKTSPRACHITSDALCIFVWDPTWSSIIEFLLFAMKRSTLQRELRSNDHHSSYIWERDAHRSFISAHLFALCECCRKSSSPLSLLNIEDIPYIPSAPRPIEQSHHADMNLQTLVIALLSRIAACNLVCVI